MSSGRPSRLRILLLGSVAVSALAIGLACQPQPSVGSSECSAATEAVVVAEPGCELQVPLPQEVAAAIPADVAPAGVFVDPSAPVVLSSPGTTPRVEDEDDKTQRVLRQLTSYMMAVAASGGSPLDRDEAARRLREKFALEWPVDRWGNPLIYQQVDARHFVIFSAGEDGTPDTSDDIHLPTP